MEGDSAAARKNDTHTPPSRKSLNPAEFALYVGLLSAARLSCELMGSRNNNTRADKRKDQPVTQSRRIRRHSFVGVVDDRTLLRGWLKADDNSVKINPDMGDGSRKASSVLLRRSLDGGRLKSIDFLPPSMKKQGSREVVPVNKAKELEDKISVQLMKVADMVTHSKDLADAFASTQNPVNIPSLYVFRKAWEDEKLALQKEKSDLEMTVYFLSQALDGSSAHTVALQGEVDSLTVDTERLMKEIEALTNTSERLRAQESEAQAKLQTLEMEKHGYLSQLANLRSRIAHSESECVELNAELGSLEEENAAAKLVIASMLETEEKIRGDINSLRNLLIEQSAMLETQRKKGEAESRELLGVLSREQSELNLAREEINGLSAALKKEKAEKEALQQEMDNLKSNNMEEEILSANQLIMAMQEEESRHICNIATLEEELAEVIVERSYLQAQMNASEDRISQMASNFNKELREAKETINRMRCHLDKAIEAHTFYSERAGSLSADLSSAGKGLKKRGLFGQKAKPTALISACSIVIVMVLSGILKR